MHPDKFWVAFRTVTRAVATKVSSDPVEALAISSHGESFIPVDAYHQPVAPAIVNIDNRAVAQAERLANVLGRQRIFEITGLAVHPMYPIPKILWLQEHLTDVFSSTARFLAVPDYLFSRLGLPACIDYSLASRFLAFDIRKRRWSEEVLSACRLRPSQFSAPVPAGTIAGQLSSQVALELGLESGTPVVVGGHDQPCAALGSGVLDPGRVSASLGTYECLVAASETPAVNEQALSANLNSYCHVVPGRFVTLAYFPSGIMMDWLLRILYSDRQLTEASVNELCAALEAQAPHGPTSLCIAPHLLGTCNPDFNPQATGVVLGIRPATGRSDLYKAVLEGLACEFASMTNLLGKVAGPCADIYVTGGGSRSRLGLNLRAALASCRLHLMRCPDAVCLGTAILAGVAVGKYASFPEAVERTVQVAETVNPDSAVTETYKAQLQQYRLLYSSLGPLRESRAAWNS
jgi:xylulokinase